MLLAHRPQLGLQALHFGALRVDLCLRIRLDGARILEFGLLVLDDLVVVAFHVLAMGKLIAILFETQLDVPHVRLSVEAHL